jgi:hypothetical protein
VAAAQQAVVEAEDGDQPVGAVPRRLQRRVVVQAKWACAKKANTSSSG